MLIYFYMLMSLVVNAIAFYVLSQVVPGVGIADVPTLLVVSVVWGVLAMLVRPVLVLLTLPINVLTLGLFTFVINALLLLLMSSIVPGFAVAGFMTALIASVVLAIINMFLGMIK